MAELERELVEKIGDGTVIDHLPAGAGLRALEILGVTPEYRGRAAVALNVRSTRLGAKDLIKLEGKHLSEREASRLALLAPHATVNTIQDYRVVKKAKIELPDELAGVQACSNPRCVTNHEHATTRFFVEKTDGSPRLVCAYCERAQ